MTKLLSTAKIIFLLSVLTPVLSFARITKLPIISVIGKVCDEQERVSVNIRLEANKYSPDYCHSEVDMPDRTIRYPHTFYLYGVTVSDYLMSFGLDIDVMERLKEKVFDYYPSGVNYEGTRITALNYFKNCNFQLNEVTVFSQQTSLIIRDSFYNNFENTFRVPQGTTRTRDYSLNRGGDRIRFKVFVNKNE